jgi:hypothetical protein
VTATDFARERQTFKTYTDLQQNNAVYLRYLDRRRVHAGRSHTATVDHRQSPLAALDSLTATSSIRVRPS